MNIQRNCGLQFHSLGNKGERERMKIELTEVSGKEDEKEVSLRLIITGTCKEAENATVCIQPPKYAEPFAYTEVSVTDLKEKETQTIDLSYKLSYGGRYVFYTWEKNSKLATLQSTIVNRKGAGVYSGNTHSHSTYSDGKSTLEENRKAMMECGHSFIYATDHNTTAHFKELEEYKEQGATENFLHIPGWEFTTQYGHSIAYGSTSTVSVEKIPERNNLQAWQEFVDEMNAQNATVYFAHPHEAPRYEFGDDVLCGIKGIAGVEAWNGYNYHALSYQNRKNFEVWDSFNRRGDHHYPGNSVSDAHTRSGQSSPYIKGFLKELSKQAVEEMLQKGSYIGSNGPEITFTLGEAGIGETCKVKKNASGKGQKVLMKLDVFDPLGEIEAVNIYRGIVDGEYTVKPNTKKIFEFYPMGDMEKRNFVRNLYIDVAAGEFYRVEVVTGVGVVAYMADENRLEKGFAFTNPIWIEE